MAILDQASGTELQTLHRRLRGGAVDSLDLNPATAHVRLRVRGEQALQVAGWVEQPGGEVTQALSLFEDTAHDDTTLDLLEAPNGRRLLLRQYILAPEGLTTTSIQDDASGWWVELKWDVRLSFKDLRDYFQNGYNRLATKPGAEVLHVLTTSSGFRFEASLPFAEMEKFADFTLLVQRVRAAGGAERFRVGLHPAVIEAAAFVAATDSCKDGQGETLLYYAHAQLLVDLARAEAAAVTTPYQGVCWQAGQREAAKGTSGLQGSYLAFARGFRSVNSEDPLAGFHVDQLRKP